MTPGVNDRRRYAPRPLRALVVLACVIWAVTACDAGPVDPPVATASPQGAASPSVGPTAAGGCGQTPLRTGPAPAWAAGGPSGLPWVLSAEGNLIGFLFVDLHVQAGADGANNKILWVSKVPRGGQPLRLSLRPADGGAAVTMTEEADSSPGEIYPSIVDVPTAGCWHVTAEWNQNRATLDLYYPR